MNFYQVLTVAMMIIAGILLTVEIATLVFRSYFNEKRRALEQLLKRRTDENGDS